MKKSKAVPKVDPYLEGLMAKLLERLVAIEKKMDQVLERGAGRPAADVPKPQPHSPAPTHLDARPSHQDAHQPRRERQLYEAICADCSKVCEVPFRPSENRPVWCKECFGKRKAGGNRAPGMPLITPVAVPPKPVSKLGAPPTPPAAAAAKKTAPPKKAAPSKKAKKRK